MVKEVAYRAEGIFLWAALVSKDLVDGYAAHDDRDTLWKRLSTLPTGLRPLFTRFFSSVDRYHREFLLSIFHRLKVHHGSVDVALATACLHHKSVTSQEDFFRRCKEVQHHIVSRSKGLIEVDTKDGNWRAVVAGGIRGLVLEDLSTQSTPQTVLEDVDFRSWLNYKFMPIKWLHRSAYDYVSGDLEADLPAWAHRVDTSLDMLSGCVWVHKYGLSVWIYSDLSDVRLYNGSRECASRIVGVRSRGKASPNDGYQALDYILSGLGSPYSDRWVQLYPDGQSRISCAMVQSNYRGIWVELVTSGFWAGLTDYVISRFEWFKRGRCVHCLSFIFWISLSNDPDTHWRSISWTI